MAGGSEKGQAVLSVCALIDKGSYAWYHLFVLFVGLPYRNDKGKSIYAPVTAQ